MESWVKKVVKEERKKRGTPLELKRIRGNYYLYHVKSVWDPAKGRARKVSGEYIGRVTRDGVREANRMKKAVRSVCEYGNAALLKRACSDIIEGLQSSFPESYQEIMAIAIVKTLGWCPIKMMKSKWEKLYLSREMKAALSPNSTSGLMQRIGIDYSSQMDFFDHLLKKSTHLIFDLSSIFSHSQNIRLAEKGFNRQHLYLKQINLSLFYSQSSHQPVMLKPIPGSIKDVKALKAIVRESGLPKCILVLDAGFASYPSADSEEKEALVDLLGEKEALYVFPLRRNFKAINYKLRLASSFVYRKKGIYCGKMSFRGAYIYLFENVSLRAEEENTFLSLIEEGKRTRDELRAEAPRFGRIALLSNMDEEPKAVYLLFKEREEIEQAFDAFKNELENDKTYLQTDEAVRGYFFISFISLYLYFKVLNMLKKAGLSDKLSVADLLFELSKVYALYHSDGTMTLSEVPAKVEKLLEELNLDILPKK